MRFLPPALLALLTLPAAAQSSPLSCAPRSLAESLYPPPLVHHAVIHVTHVPSGFQTTLLPSVPACGAGYPSGRGSTNSTSFGVETGKDNALSLTAVPVVTGLSATAAAHMTADGQVEIVYDLFAAYWPEGKPATDVAYKNAPPSADEDRQQGAYHVTPDSKGSFEAGSFRLDYELRPVQP